MENSGFLPKAIQHLDDRRSIEQSLREKPVATIRGQFWSQMRAFRQFYDEHLVELIRNGCTYPDMPIELSAQDTCLLNFGTCPELLRLDLLHLSASQQPDQEVAELSPAMQDTSHKLLRKLFLAYGENHGCTRIYNLEPWLQEMHNDCLDTDYAEKMRQHIDHRRQAMNAVPRGLASVGLRDQALSELMQCFQQFRDVLESSHMLEHDKSSFTGRREFARTMSTIEQAIKRAENELGVRQGKDRSQIRELFEYWKESSYEIFELNRKLRSTWAGNKLDTSIALLMQMFTTIQATAQRCAEDDETPYALRRIFSAQDLTQTVSRVVVENALEALMLFDLVGKPDLAAQRLETRRYGPLSVLLYPCVGKARYSSELRDLFGSSTAGNDSEGPLRDFDFDRRSKYPLNCIVMPVLTPSDSVVVDLADAWLEFKSYSQPGAYRNTVEEAKRLFPDLFDPRANANGPVIRTRRALAKYITAMIRWSRTGEMEDLPRFDSFLKWARSRMPSPQLLSPPRHRATLAYFADASPKKREFIYQQHLGERYEIDRKLVAIHFLKKDWDAVKIDVMQLPAELREKKTLVKAFEPPKEWQIMPKDRTETFILQFIQSDSELKAALVAMESQVNLDVQTLQQRLRQQKADPLPPQLAYRKVLGHHERQLLDSRMKADENNDRNLNGLLFAVDGNMPAAIEELTAFINQWEKTPITTRRDTARAFDESWFMQIGNRKQFIPDDPEGEGDAEDLAGICSFAHYNLGWLYRQAGNLQAALQCFTRFEQLAKRYRWHLFAVYAGEILQELGREIRGGGKVEGDSEQAGSLTDI